MLGIIIQGIKSSNLGFKYFESGIIKCKWHERSVRHSVIFLIWCIRCLTKGIYKESHGVYKDSGGRTLTNGFDEWRS